MNGVLIAVFIYWGWDSTVTVNEETENPGEAPGRAALLSTVILVLHLRARVGGRPGLQRPGGPRRQGRCAQRRRRGRLRVAARQDRDHRGPDVGAASCQTTILPNARTALSMARRGAYPKPFGEVSPRYLTPHTATIIFGVLSVVWYVALTAISENILFDSIAALGLMIAFYYALTGFACVIYYRRELFKSARNLLMVGVAPLIGSLMLTGLFVKSCVDLSDPGELRVGRVVVRAGPPLVIGLGFLCWASS